MTKCILLSATYQDRKAVLKFYDPVTNKIVFYRDNTGHLPHCYVEPETWQQIKELDGVTSGHEVMIHDVIRDEKRTMMKVFARDPLVIGGKEGQGFRDFQKTWESDIKYYETYLYDKGFIVGKWYDVTDDKINQITQDSKFNVDVNSDGVIEKERFLGHVSNWAKLLSEPIPHIRRMAFDIEVEVTGDTLPDPLLAPQRVTAISFHGEDIHKCFVLRRSEISMGEADTECELKWFDSEKDMLVEAFNIISSYPMVLTYNGDIFDMPYLHNRAIRLGMKITPFKMMAKNATLHNGIHIDMYGVFANRSLKVYSFKSLYVDDSLNSVSLALLKEKKTEYEGELTQIPLLLLAKYCYNDARLTYKLSSYNNDLVMNLLIILCRIGNMPIDDISRMSISHWIKSMFYFNHRQAGELIPRNDDFPQAEASTQSSTDKKYEGAIVIEPQKGIHFNVTVVDFASLYPSIIKTKNISYETVRCSHQECMTNMIPQTKHWSCTKKSGIASLLIGSLKELRVGHFKKLSKKATDEKEKQQYETISEALKVFLNASYGVIGAEIFTLYYLPTAEAVTAYGRDIIMDTVNKAKGSGMNVIYGDTDSIFIRQPTQEQINNLIKYAKGKFNIDLEQDKEYRYVILSNLKKNYFGIKKDGSADIKGLTGKKSHTPPFIRNLFSGIVDELKKIERLEQFEPTKNVVINNIKATVNNFDNIPLKDMAFTMKINNDPSEYKTNTQTMKVVQQLGKKPVKGQFVSFIKTWTEPGVKPVSLVQRGEIDKPKYLDSLQSTLEQITNSLDIDFDVLLGRGRATKLEEFFI